MTMQTYDSWSESALPEASGFIAVFEGKRNEAYLCEAGLWTIGYGHTKKTLDLATCVPMNKQRNDSRKT